MPEGIKKTKVALADLFSWLGQCPLHQKVADLSPSQGTYLSCEFYYWSECMQEAEN